MGKRINNFVRRLPAATRVYVREELRYAGAGPTVIRRVMPGEEPGHGDYICQGKTWAVDEVKKGAIQMCPREDLQFIRYNPDFDHVQRFCPRCAVYMIAHPEDTYLEGLDIPAEVPMNGWRPDPVPEGWKP